MTVHLLHHDFHSKGRTVEEVLAERDQLYRINEGADMQNTFNVPVRRKPHAFVVTFGLSIVAWCLIGAALIAWGM